MERGLWALSENKGLSVNAHKLIITAHTVHTYNYQVQLDTLLTQVRAEARPLELLPGRIAHHGVGQGHVPVQDNRSERSQSGECSEIENTITGLTEKIKKNFLPPMHI